jgi:protein gp37
VAKNSRIEWTTHTFNPWWGCVKVSPACKHCYAESWAKRVGKDIWGLKAERRFFGEKHWAEPLRWNKDAGNTGDRARVFCASMGDVFENRRDLDVWRTRLWELIEATPNLDWLLLTKRPELVTVTVPWQDRWPRNVWLGTTVEDQRRANERLPILTSIPAAVRFISAVPFQANWPARGFKSIVGCGFLTRYGPGRVRSAETKISISEDWAQSHRIFPKYRPPEEEAPSHRHAALWLRFEAQH